MKIDENWIEYSKCWHYTFLRTSDYLYTEHWTLKHFGFSLETGATNYSIMLNLNDYYYHRKCSVLSIISLHFLFILSLFLWAKNHKTSSEDWINFNVLEIHISIFQTLYCYRIQMNITKNMSKCWCYTNRSVINLRWYSIQRLPANNMTKQA